MKPAVTIPRLPLNIAVKIALKIEDWRDLTAWCCTESRMFQMFMTAKFRQDWITARNPPELACIFDQEEQSTGLPHSQQPQKSARLEGYKAQIISDATDLRLKLPASAWRSYCSAWLSSRHNKKLPVVFKDAPVISEFVLHAWFDVIPRFVKNQLLPPSSDLEGWTAGDSLEQPGLLVINAGRDEFLVGPDTPIMMEWFGDIFDLDPEFPELRTTSDHMVPEGLLRATRLPALRASFQRGWSRPIFEMMFDDLPEIWNKWISQNSNGRNWRFNSYKLERLKKFVKRDIDPTKRRRFCD